MSMIHLNEYSKSTSTLHLRTFANIDSIPVLNVIGMTEKIYPHQVWIFHIANSFHQLTMSV